MELGAFSISLAVRDLEASRSFYEKLGFTTMGGEAAQGWLILKNGDTLIGIFQGMFEKNMLTFNPGWDVNAQNLATFADVRDIQRHLLEQGVPLDTLVDPAAPSGPGYIMLTDPDGNPILIDQHR